MSSEADFIAMLVSVRTSLFQFGGPVLMAFGTVGSVLSSMVFMKKNLRKNPCSMYFLAMNAANLFLIYTSMLLSTLPIGYNIDISLYNLDWCHFRFYAALLFDILSPSYLVLASVDRVLLTSRNFLTRRRSTHRLALTSIIAVTLFWLGFHSHALILVNIQQVAPGFSVCYFQTGNYLVFISCYSIIIKGILVPLLMIVFGCWTVRNVRKVGVVHPGPISAVARLGISHDMHSRHSRDRLLIRLLLVDVSVYITFSTMLVAILMYQQVNQYQSQNVVQGQVLTLLLAIGTFCSYVPASLGCYINILVSQSFRREIKNIVMCK